MAGAVMTDTQTNRQQRAIELMQASRRVTRAFLPHMPVYCG